MTSLLSSRKQQQQHTLSWSSSSSPSSSSSTTTTEANRKPVQNKANNVRKNTSITSEKKEDLKLKQSRDFTRLLRQVAFIAEEPQKRSITAWAVFVRKHIVKGIPPRDQLKPLAVRFHELNEDQLQEYNTISRTESQDRVKKYSDWVLSHTPEQIRLANQARKALNRRSKDGKTGFSNQSTRIYRSIRDNRQVKRARSANVLYMQERHRSGEFVGVPAIESMKQINADFKLLLPHQRRKYETLAAEEHAEYVKRVRKIYGHSLPNHSDVPETPSSST